MFSLAADCSPMILTCRKPRLLYLPGAAKRVALSAIDVEDVPGRGDAHAIFSYTTSLRPRRKIMTRISGQHCARRGQARPAGCVLPYVPTEDCWGWPDRLAHICRYGTCGIQRTFLSLLGNPIDFSWFSMFFIFSPPWIELVSSERGRSRPAQRCDDK